MKEAKHFPANLQSMIYNTVVPVEDWRLHI